VDKPSWWDWELELTPHLQKRMLQRDFTEVDLRTMVSNATNCAAGSVPGRWLLTTRQRDVRWEVVVEPDVEERLLVVVTAYQVEG
jgi:hypothetical protein